MDKVTRQGSVQFNISYEMQLTNSKLSGDKNLSETDGTNCSKFACNIPRECLPCNWLDWVLEELYTHWYKFM